MTNFRKAGLALAASVAGLFAFTAQGAWAAGEFGVQPSVSTLSSTGTVRAVTVASHTATSVVVSTGFASVLYRGVYVQNLSQNGAINCSESVDVSTQSANVHFGIMLASAAAISPPLPFYFPLPAGGNLYCKCNAHDLTCRVTTYRVR